MDYLFNLGSYRRGLVLAFATLITPVISFCQWDGTDSDALSNIERDVDDIAQDVGWIRSYSSSNKSTLESGLLYLERLRNLTYTSNNDLRVSDTGLLHKASSIDSKMDRIEQAINNLTNYMCYSSDYICTFNSNIAFLATSYYGGAWPRISSSKNQVSSQIQAYIDDGDYSSLFRDYGLWTAFPMEYFTKVSTFDLPGGYSGTLGQYVNDSFNALYSVNLGPAARVRLRKFSEPYYYQYGTRQFTDSFLQYTNQILFALNQINDSLTNHLDPRFISSSTSESGTSYGFTQAAGNVARGMSESATQLFSIEDNITQVETNPIVAISDSGYQSRMDQATRSNPSDGLGQVADDLNSYLQQNETDLESILQDSVADYTFYFEVPVFSMGRRSGTIRKGYVVPNTNSSTRPYLAFICGVIKFALSLYFAYYVWDKVVLDLWKF